MATSYNFGAVESEQRQLSITKNPGKKYTEASGVRETIVYTGPWSEIEAMARAAAANAEPHMSVQVDADRSGGEVGELRITTEAYTEPLEDDPEEDEEEDSDLGTENNPCYTESSTLVPTSLLAHPKLKNLSPLERRAALAMINGQDENSLLDDDTTATGTVRIVDCFTSSLGKFVYEEFLSLGIFSWNDISTEATARWKGGSNSYKPGTIVETTPGGFPSGPGRNWLCSGTGKEKNGTEKWNTSSFRLSGMGGWHPWLYDGSQS